MSRSQKYAEDQILFCVIEVDILVNKEVLVFDEVLKKHKTSALIFLKQYIMPIVTANSMVKHFVEVVQMRGRTTPENLKGATQVGLLTPHFSIQVGLTPPVPDSRKSGAMSNQREPD